MHQYESHHRKRVPVELGFSNLGLEPSCTYSCKCRGMYVYAYGGRVVYFIATPA